MSIDLSGYNDVAARMIEFREKYPAGTLQPIDPGQPFQVVTVGEKTFIQYTAAAYRTPDDPRPGIGVAWEPFPGRTNYTRDSELQNAETSAWGRAILAVGAADAKKGVASAEEVRNRTADREQWDDAQPARPQMNEANRQAFLTNARAAIVDAGDVPTFDEIDARIGRAAAAGVITGDDATALRTEMSARVGDIGGEVAGDGPEPQGEQAQLDVR